MAGHQRGAPWENEGRRSGRPGGLFKVPEDKPTAPCPVPGTTRVLRAGSLLGRAWMEGDAEGDGRQDGKGEGEEFTALSIS